MKRSVSLSPVPNPLPEPFEAPSPSHNSAQASCRNSAPRVGHSKSRNGCRTCKRRRVKCDETRPSCRNCIKYEARCEYGPILIPKINGSHKLEMGLQTNSSLSCLQLELMYNFTTSTYATLSSSPQLKQFWRVSIPRLALTHEYLMRSVLAISALHLAHHRPESRDTYVSEGLMHHRIASEAATSLLEDVTKENAVGLLVFSTLTIFVALGTPKRSTRGVIPAEEGQYENWVFLMQGTKSLIEIMGEDVHDTMLAPLLEYGRERWNIQNCGIEDAALLEKGMLDSLQELIWKSTSDEKALLTYNATINRLRSAIHSMFRSDSMDAFIWIHRCVDDFLPLLEVPTQEALVIFAHFCVILKRSETQWWLQGWADRTMSAIYQRLEERYRPWISWPAEVIGWVAPPA